EAITDFMRRYADSPLDGKYQILARLGVGGMGEVYKALHIHLNALRVIKLMRSGIANDQGAHERFLREARMATRIHHPNVAALFKISDLGIAKQWGDTTESKTKTGMFVGKLMYCSPEHLGIVNEGELIDGRADIYSFGIVLYEMLTGVPPFQADTPHRYLMMHASEQPKSLQQTNPTTTASPELEALIFRALERDSNKRFATAREFGKAIEALIPTLDDKPGALPVLPTASELTAEPTRPSVDVRAPTLPDLATTVKTVKG